MPLIRRVPKRGFTNIFRVEYAVVNLRQLQSVLEADDQAEITPDLLREHGLIKKAQRLKILGDGEIEKPLQVSAHKFSATARQKIEAAGGRCEELEK